MASRRMFAVRVDPATATADQASLVDLVNGIVRWSIATTIVLTAISAAFEVRRLVRFDGAQAASSSVVAG